MRAPFPRSEVSPTGGRAIRTRPVTLLLALALALVLAACGTWDPTNQPDDGPVQEGAGTVGLEVGETPYSFSVDECFASPEDGIDVRATTAGGEQLHINYDADAPRDRTLQVTGENNEIIYDGNATEGIEGPALRVGEGSFSGTATFRSTDGSEVGGELSGAC